MSKQHKKKKEKSISIDKNTCIFCGSNEDNEILLGKYITSKFICIHSYCMYFSSGLSQQNDSSGQFLGFRIPDIETEFRRGRKLFCSYCRKRGATVGCCTTTCKKSFHLNCGIQNGSLHQFFGSFQSFCKEHKPRQSRLKIEDEFYCYICCEGIKPDEVDSCLYSPCCKKNLFHKLCLQKYALSAGIHFFKCPLCNNAKKFLKEMQKFGINIPEKDASWELEENAFQELLVKPKCDAPICLCPKGRDYCSERKNDWKLLTCFYCGFHARHKNCGNVVKKVKKWLCEECTALSDEIAKNKAIRELENKSGNCNLSLSPKVVLENCLAANNYLQLPVTNGDTLANSGNVSCQRSTRQTCISTTESSATFKTDELNNFSSGNSVQTSEISDNEQKFECMDTSDESVVAGPSTNRQDNQERKESLVPIMTFFKLSDRESNLRDIKNFPPYSETKQGKKSPKTKTSKKIPKKQKVDKCNASESQALITSFFGHVEKKIRL